MTGGEEESKKGERKGFAGLSTLVSEVDTTPPPAAPKEEPAAAALSAGHATAQPPQPQPQPSQQRQTYQESAQPPPGGSSAGKWLLGIVAVIGAFWLIGQLGKNTTSPAPTYLSPPQAVASSYSPPAEPQAPSRPEESMPPSGKDLVLSTAQIHYCLAEDIRMDGAKSAVDNYSDNDVDRFNAMVADYNSRCGSFHYRSGALESARSDIAPWRSEIYAEGQNRLAGGAYGGSKAASSQKVEPTKSGTMAAAPQQASAADSWHNQASDQGPSGLQQNEAATKAAAQSEWEATISNWARSHSDFLSDSSRTQKMQAALAAINSETGGSLSNKDLINAAYRRAAIATGWLTEIPSTAAGKPMSKFNPIASGLRASSSAGDPTSCPSGTTWVSEKGQCCERLDLIPQGGGAVSPDWVGCRSPRGTQVEHGHTSSRATCVYKSAMSSDDLRACGLDPATRGG